MGRTEFIRRLEYGLGNINAGAKREILADFGEHFDAALAGGKNEEEICEILGDPDEIAREFVSDYRAAGQETDRFSEERFANAPAAPVAPVAPVVPAGGINKIKIEAISCDLYFTGENTDSISAEFDGDCRERFVTEISGGVYYVKEKAFKQLSDNLLGRLASFAVRRDAKMRITVPRGFAGEIEATTASGDAGVKDLPSLGSLSLKTASGDIEISSVISSGAVSLLSGSGDIEAVNAGSEGAINLKTGSGDVALRKCGAETINTSSGSGDIESDGSRGIIYAKTGSGGIEILNHSGTAEGKTGSGDIDVKTDELKTALEYSTGSGDIRIECENLSADLKMTSGSGDIFLRAARVSADVAAKTWSGNIGAEFGRGCNLRFELKAGRNGRKRNGFDETGSRQYAEPARKVSFETNTGDIEIKSI